ncbi:MAG TPA: OB-fold nucleic acid binding domain-containing protein [bacterium]|nr:OB-fold nucleic acid binding domain-containing protein [bacterium]
MAKQMAADLKAGDHIATFLQIDEASVFNFQKKPGKYAVFTFKDRSGSVKGVCWDRGEEYFSSFGDGQVVFVEGRVESYRGSIQIVVDAIIDKPDGSFDPDDFLVKTTLDVEALCAYISETIGKIKNRHIRQLLELFYEDPEFADKFRRSPAAKSIHHSYLGGLAEHTANCLRLAETLCDVYPQLDRDLLYAGVLLHDSGKTVELSCEHSVDYTDQGRLLGHIVIGYTMVLDKIRQIEGFPDSKKDELLHLIISHHGENATGSPKRPKMAEACALHFLENLDAQTKRFLQIVEESGPGAREAKWTAYNRMLERYIYRKPVDEDQ